MQVVTLGPAGTYSHRAAQAVTDDIVFRESVTGIIEAVLTGAVARGVIPIENSIEGSVTESLDAIAQHDISVLREIVTPIRHALIAQDSTPTVVVSHAQALAQCREYLDSEYPDLERRAVASTAKGVEQARQDPQTAAIAHPQTATGSLRVLAENIQDRSSNATRFFLIGPLADRNRAGGKSSFVFYPSTDYPGLLLRLLEPFAERDINLTRIESRPSGDRLGDYIFHLDIAAGLYEDRTQQALGEVEEIVDAGWVKRVGSYDVEHVL